MSANSSPSHYTEDAFVADANFKVDINQKMKVPDRISFNTDVNGGNQTNWVRDDLTMNVPERILVAGQHQHVGTRAPPLEIVYDNSQFPTESYSNDLPRVATPPRNLTLDKYPFPALIELLEDEAYALDSDESPQSNLQGTKGKLFTEASAAVLNGVGAENLTPAEEVLHLRRQMAKLNRRVMALELDNLNRLQKEKFLVGFGVAYFLLKVIIWMNRD